MVLLPSLMATATIPRGHIYHTQITPSRSLSLAFPTRGPGGHGGAFGVTGSSADKNVTQNRTTMSLTATSKAGVSGSIASLGPKTAAMIASGSLKTLPSTLEATMAPGRSYMSRTSGAMSAMLEDNNPNLLPTRGHAASDFVYEQWHPSVFSNTRKRTEWLDKHEAKHKGEIRNIRCLGVIGECLVVAYQGAGGVRTFIDHGSSLELEEIIDNDTEEKKRKYKKYRKYVDGHNHSFRFAQYKKPALPTSVLIMGSTAAPAARIQNKVSQDIETPSNKPAREAATKAFVAVSGHVTSNHPFLLS